MRYRHYLQRLNGNKWPARILLVDCVGSWTAKDGDEIQYEQLASWHVQKVIHHGVGYIQDYSMCGQLAASFWDLIRSELTETTYIWLISLNCGRIWSLLDVWRGIENGEIRAIGRDYRESDDSKGAMHSMRTASACGFRQGGGNTVRRMQKRSAGYLVIQCPPAVLRFRLSNCACPSQWVDVENYGVEESKTIQPGKKTTDWLAQWIDQIARLFNECKLGSLQATAGSQALTAWKTSYYHPGVYVHTNKSGLELESASLFGGRCECHFLGTVPGKAYHLDFRSMYPSICVTHSQGIRLRSVIRDKDFLDWNSVGDSRQAIVDVTIETDEPSYPYRREKDIIYPIGRFRTVLCGPELIDARRHNRVVKIHRANIYDTGQPLKNYAISLYNCRLRAEQMETHGVSSVIKRLLVGISGKFGQRDRRWIDRPEQASSVPYGEWYDYDVHSNHSRFRSIAWRVQQELTLGFSADSVPSITSWIMSAGRMRLLQAIRIAGWDNVYYCDTDSLIVNQTGYYSLVQAGMVRNKELGFLYVKSIAQNCNIMGVKTYHTEHEYVAAGVPITARATGETPGSYFRQVGPTDSIRNGTSPVSCRIKESIQKSEQYKGRMVLAGGRTQPIRIDSCK